MSEEIVLYTNPKSRGRIALWMLEEVGVPFRAQYLGFGAPMESASYRALNPMGKVPTIVHGKTIVTEAAAICCYLADAFPKAHLAPPPAERADYYRWLFFVAGPVELSFTNHVLGVEVPEAMRRSVGYNSQAATAAALEEVLSKRPYLAGEAFTAADVFLGTQLGWFLEFGIVEKRAAFTDYAARLGERPAFQRAKARDEAALAEEQGAVAT